MSASWDKEPRSRRQGGDCLSDLQFDRLLTGELDAAGVARIEGHAGACAPCGQRLSTLRAQHEGFASAMNLAQMAVDTLARAAGPRRPQRSWTRWLGFLVPAAGVAAALLVMAVRPRPQEPYLGIKGGFGLSAFVKHVDQGGAGVAMAPGETVHPRDRVQFRVSSDHPGYLAVVSIDARAQVSVYYPPGDQAARLDAGRDIALSTAVELDDTLGAERIIAVRCPVPFPVAAALDAARAGLAASAARGAAPTELAALGLAGCAETTFGLQKAPAPAAR